MKEGARCERCWPATGPRPERGHRRGRGPARMAAAVARDEPACTVPTAPSRSIERPRRLRSLRGVPRPGCARGAPGDAAFQGADRGHHRTAARHRGNERSWSRYRRVGMKLCRILRAGSDGPSPASSRSSPEKASPSTWPTADAPGWNWAGPPPRRPAGWPGRCSREHCRRPRRWAAFRERRTSGDHWTRRDDGVVPLDDMRLIAPVDPPTMHDGSAFEQHLVNAHARGSARCRSYSTGSPPITR